MAKVLAKLMKTGIQTPRNPCKMLHGDSGPCAVPTADSGKRDPHSNLANKTSHIPKFWV